MTRIGGKGRRRDIVGADISRDRRGVFRLSDQQSNASGNEAAGVWALLNGIGSAEDVQIVCEPTGPCPRGMEAERAEAGHALIKVAPRQARRFAAASGPQAKTDRGDAMPLARMGRRRNALTPGPWRRRAAVTAGMLPIGMPALGSFEPERAASLAGLAPFGAVDGTGEDPRRTRQPARRDLHAGPGRDPVQCRTQARTPPAARTRQGAEARDHRDPAPAHTARQRADARRPETGRQNRMTKRDPPAGWQPLSTRRAPA